MCETDPLPGRRLTDAVRRIADETRGVDHDDADEVLGTFSSDDAIGFDPMPLLGALDRRGAEVVIMGQVAGIMHGSTELTGDLDLLWSGSLDQTATMAAAFADAGAELEDDEDRPVPCDPTSFELPKVTFRSAHASGDCGTPNLPWCGLDVVGMLDRAEQATLDGVRLRFLAVSDLIAMRSIVTRPKDVRRVDELRRLHPDVG